MSQSLAKQTRTRVFSMRTPIPVSAEMLFAWHEEPDAFKRLTPPWEKVRVLRHVGGIRDGAEVSLLVGPMPFALRWDLTHCDYEPGRSFTDKQVAGPFKSWRHIHRMIPEGPDRCTLEDHIEYELPGGWIGGMLGGWIVKRKLARLFAYRHQVTYRAMLEAKSRP